MTNYVKINFKGKNYIGLIKNVEIVSQELIFTNGEKAFNPLYYLVTIIEKDTNCCISNIKIKNFFDIKPYEEKE